MDDLTVLLQGFEEIDFLEMMNELTEFECGQVIGMNQSLLFGNQQALLND